MKSLSFRKDLVGVQDELLRFAYKLTTDREEANDLLQETSLKALDNEAFNDVSCNKSFASSRSVVSL